MPYRPSQTIDSVGERSGTTAMPSKHDRRHTRWRPDPEGESRAQAHQRFFVMKSSGQICGLPKPRLIRRADITD